MDGLAVDVREIGDHYPEYAEPFEPTGQGRHHGALSWQGGQNGALSWQLRHYGARPWGLAVGLVLILLTALLSRPPVPVPPPGPEPPIIIPEPEPEPTPVPPDDPVIPPDEPDEPPEPPVTVRHTVTFVDWDGTLLLRDAYGEGTAASDITVPATPTRPSDGSYTYTFAGWTPALADVTEDATYKAVYTATPIGARHTVTFVNWDGSLLSRRQYPNGTSASDIIRPATPTRRSDGSYTYTFAGWSPSLRTVTSDITYRATFTATPIPVGARHTVTFRNWDGTQLSSRQYAEGTAASAIVRPATPTRPSDGSYTYTFAGWSPAITAVTADATYTATYTATPVPVQYTVTFVNWDSSVISSAKYDEGTPASSIVVPADPTRPSDGSYNYIFIAWTPALADVTADATYTAQYLAEELPTYDLPEVDIEHEIYYWDGADEYFADFTASVTLKDVAGCTGQLKLMHYDGFTDAWEWAEFTGEDGVSYGNYYVLVKLYTVKDGVRTEFTPSDLNAPYDIPDDAEGLEADISWWFPWYVDDDDNFLPRVRETLNLEFDYTLPNGESGTVSLENDFHLYKDWFFGWGDTAVLDETAKTITIEVPYQVDYGGPLNYDNVYWHCHLYWQPEDDYHWNEKGTELEITPTVTTVTREDGTVAARIVYTLDEVVPGRLYDFYADVIYSDYGVDDADYWNNWVETYDATHMSF